MVLNRTLVIVAGVVLAGALALRLFFFGVSLKHLPVVSDEAITMLQAKWIRHGTFPLLTVATPYEVPIESYLAAPWISWLPRNELGARLQGFVLALLTVLGGWLIYRRLAPLKTAWPGLLLLLFPSTYFLELQAGYIMPHTISVLTWCWLALWLYLLSLDIEGIKRYKLRGLAGCFAGIAFCDQMMALSFVAVFSTAVCLGRHWRDAAKSAAVYLTGLAVGLIPFGLGYWLQPGAHVAVEGIATQRATVRLAGEMVGFTLPGVLGINPVLYPDYHRDFTLVMRDWLPVFGEAYLVLLALATLFCLFYFFRRLWRDRWPSLTANDVFVGTSWAAIVLFLLSARSHKDCLRFLLLLIWSFPFVASFVYARAHRRLRPVLGGLIVLLVVFNIATAVGMMGQWSQPGYARKRAQTPDLAPALAYLRQQGIRHCYAQHWAAYRIDYLTDEAIVCSQPYNEHFVGWPIPYKAEVDAATNVAYVLTPVLPFSMRHFNRHLDAQGIRYTEKICGDFFVYHHFGTSATETVLPAEHLSISAYDGSADTWLLNDGNKSNRWMNSGFQLHGMWLQLDLVEPENVCAVRAYYNTYPHDRADSLNVWVKAAAGWKKVLSDVDDDLDPFIMKGDHPVMGDRAQTFRFPPVETDCVRLEIERPMTDRNWSIQEIEVLTSP